MLLRLIKRIRESFSAKIIALVVASVLVTSFVVGLATTRSTGNFLTEKTSEKFPSTLRSTETRLRVWYKDQFQDLERLCQSKIFSDNLERVLASSVVVDSVSQAEIRKYFRLVHRKFPVYDDLMLLRLDGHVLTTASGRSPGDLSPVRSQIAEGPVVAQFTNAWPSADERRVFQWLLVPLKRDDVMRAWMVARVDLDELAELLRESDRGRGSDLFLLDGQGRFLTQPRIAEENVLSTRAMQVPTRQSGPIRVNTRSSHDGREVFHAKVHLEELGWWLVYEEDFKQAMLPVFSAQRRIWVAVLIIGAMAILAALRIAQSILRPIHDLSLGARRVNEGLVGVKIPKGADDEIGMMIDTFNEMATKISVSQAELNYKNKVLNTTNEQLQEMNTRLEELSVTDGLTGLFNHRHFWNLLNTELTRVNLYQGDLALVLIDLDDFKRVNDQFGHAVGDMLLQVVARILKDTVRGTDIVARYGGEEFAILLPDTNREGVEQVSEKLRRSVELMRFKVPDTDIVLRLTVSAGVSVFRGNRREFFNAADKALYQSKTHGKNQIHYALT